MTTGIGNLSNTSVTANSLSHYLGVAAPTPSIAIVKQTNGQVALNPPGPVVPVGSTVTWTYDVTNPGDEPLKNVTVTDDNGTPGDPADDFNPTPVLVGRLQRRRHQQERPARPGRGLEVHLHWDRQGRPVREHRRDHGRR